MSVLVHLQAGLGSWFSLQGLATGCIIGQWWLASAIYRFAPPQTQPITKAEQTAEQTAEQIAEQTDEEAGEAPIPDETGVEWLFNDPDFPTAFRDDD